VRKAWKKTEVENPRCRGTFWIVRKEWERPVGKRFDPRRGWIKSRSGQKKGKLRLGLSRVEGLEGEETCVRRGGGRTVAVIGELRRASRREIKKALCIPGGEKD